MKSNHLLLLALKTVSEHVGAGRNTSRFLTSELGLLRSVQGIADVIHFIPMEGQPYRLTEGRVVYFRAGVLRLRVNLREMEFKTGDLLIVSPGTVFEFLYVSPDLDLSMLAFSNSLMENWQKEELLQTYLQGRLCLHLSLTAQEVQRMEQLFALLWEVVHDQPFPKASVQSLISLFSIKWILSGKADNWQKSRNEPARKKCSTVFWSWSTNMRFVSGASLFMPIGCI